MGSLSFPSGRRSSFWSSLLSQRNTIMNTCEFEHRPHNQWPSHAGAENLAGSCEWYPQGITPVFDNWKNSPGHNVNMLGDHKVMGVGLGQKKGCEKFCWTSGNQADQEGSVIVAMYG